MRPVAAVGVALTLAALGMPSAHADDGQITLFAALQNQSGQVVLPANGVATEVDVAVSASDSTGALTTVVNDVTVDITLPTSGPVTATLSDPRCTFDGYNSSGAAWSCLIPSITTDYTAPPTTIPVMMIAPVGTPNGTNVPITIGASAPGASTSYPFPDTVTVVDGPNLVVGASQVPSVTLNRGDRSNLPAISVTNNGTEPALGVTIEFSTFYYAQMANDRSNCAQSTLMPFGNGLVCYINTVIQPGETYQITNAPSFRVRTDTALGASDDVQVSFTPGDDTASLESGYGSPYTPGTGAALALTRTVGTGPVQTTTGSVQQQNFPMYGLNNVDEHVVIADGLSTDLVAVGDRQSVTGTGSLASATVSVGVRNAGPATLIDRAGTGVAHLQFTVPTGATVTAAPSNCTPVTTDGSWPQQGAPGYSVYDCFTYSLSAHERHTWDFTLTLAPGIAKATGTAMIHYVGDGGPGPFPQGWDTDATNDSAPVVVTSN